MSPAASGLAGALTIASGDATADFTFTDRYPNTDPDVGNGVIWQLNMNPATGTAATNGVISYNGAFVRYAFALAANTSVGPASTTFSTSTQITLGSKYASGGAASYYGGFAAGPNATTGAVAPGTQSVGSLVSPMNR